MRQHPIPQNVLDVEFKLFTRFTVKEFAYISTGIVIGAIFIFLWTENRIPALVAFPSFAMFSGAGLILGLVPIQDQPADKILGNYIKAINRPTLRVWQGEEMKLKLKDRQNAGKASVVEAQKTGPKAVNLLDVDEKERLDYFEKLMDETGLKSEKKELHTQQTSTKIQKVVISNSNIDKYLVPNLNIKLLGTVNLLLLNKQGRPISDATVIVKDSADKPRLATKSGRQGDVLTSKKLEKGEYKIEIMHDQYTFNPITFLIEDDIYPVIKITSV